MKELYKFNLFVIINFLPKEELFRTINKNKIFIYCFYLLYQKSYAGLFLQDYRVIWPKIKKVLSKKGFQCNTCRKFSSDYAKLFILTVEMPEFGKEKDFSKLLGNLSVLLNKVEAEKNEIVCVDLKSFPAFCNDNTFKILNFFSNNNKNFEIYY